MMASLRISRAYPEFVRCMAKLRVCSGTPYANEVKKF